MNYLNDAAASFPAAISFAAGRPADGFFSLADSLSKLPLFIEHFAQANGYSLKKAEVLISQYGPSAGLLSSCIIKQLDIDAGIQCRPIDVIVTCGAQEAMFLCLPEVCPNPGDVLLVRNPTYIGITGAAELNRTDLFYLTADCACNIPPALDDAVSHLKLQGKRARALYLIPDFDNPNGDTITEIDRRSILDICSREGIIILEDNPYGMFRFDGRRIPSLYELDDFGCVIYIGTYSKTLCPTLRVGFLIFPKDQRGAGLRNLVEQRKSFASLNTSQIMQAAVGGTLIAGGYSLSNHIRGPLALYRSNRDMITACLADAYSRLGLPRYTAECEGGFFLTLKLPDQFGVVEMSHCARSYGVLMMPLSFFSFNNTYDNVVRLAFSNVDSGNIREGIERLENFIRDYYIK